MHFAAKSGSIEICHELFKYPELELEPLTDTRKTPLHVASEHNHVPVVTLLLDKGASINARDTDEATPLHCAAESGSIDVVKYLLTETQADQTLRNKFGYCARDVSMNLETRQVFTGGAKEEEEAKYGRTEFGGKLIHNDRLNAVRNLMRKYEGVNKNLQQEKQD